MYTLIAAISRVRAKYILPFAEAKTKKQAGGENLVSHSQNFRREHNVRRKTAAQFFGFSRRDKLCPAASACCVKRISFSAMTEVFDTRQPIGMSEFFTISNNLHSQLIDL